MEHPRTYPERGGDGDAGGVGMKQFAIMDGDMFFQRLEPNERYAKSVSGIQTDLHTYSEYTPIFGHEEKWMDDIKLAIQFG